MGWLGENELATMMTEPKMEMHPLLLDRHLHHRYYDDDGGDRGDLVGRGFHAFLLPSDLHGFLLLFCRHPLLLRLLPLIRLKYQLGTAGDPTKKNGNALVARRGAAVFTRDNKSKTKKGSKSETTLSYPIIFLSYISSPVPLI
jgi:hypothetical protein